MTSDGRATARESVGKGVARGKPAKAKGTVTVERMGGMK